MIVTHLCCLAAAVQDNHAVTFVNIQNVIGALSMTQNMSRKLNCEETRVALLNAIDAFYSEEKLAIPKGLLTLLDKLKASV